VNILVWRDYSKICSLHQFNDDTCHLCSKKNPIFLTPPTKNDAFKQVVKYLTLMYEKNINREDSPPTVPYMYSLIARGESSSLPYTVPDKYK